MKLINVTQLTNERFLNLYTLEYEHEGKTIKWTLASRNKPEDLICVTGKQKADTVCIVPKIKIEGKEFLVLTKEFRQPINDYVYSFPAGLVEDGEEPLTSALRELKEEIGAEEIAEVNTLTNVCYNSEGMTDESVIIYEIVVTKLGKQNLQDHEDIRTFIVPIEELENFIKGKKLSSRAGIYCPMIAREYKLKKELEEAKNKTFS